MINKGTELNRKGCRIILFKQARANSVAILVGVACASPELAEARPFLGEADREFSVALLDDHDENHGIEHGIPILNSYD